MNLKYTLKTLAWALAATLCASVPVGAQAPLPADVPVSLETTGSQSRATAVIDVRDFLLVAWRDSTGTGSQVYLQSFDRQGGRLGDILPASIYPTTQKGTPQLAVDFSGRAVVAWPDGLWPNSRIYFRHFTATGVSLDRTMYPDAITRVIRGRTLGIASDSLGNTLLVWEDFSTSGFDILGTRFAWNDSLYLGVTDTTVHQWVGNHQLNVNSHGDQVDPAVAADRKGDAMVAWRNLDPDSIGICVAVYDDRGHELFRRLLLPSDSVALTDISPPSVTRSYISQSSSDFLVSWVERKSGAAAAELKLFKITMRVDRLPHTVQADSAALLVRSSADLSFDRPSLSANETGRVVLTWSEKAPGGVSQLYYYSYGLSQGPSGARSGPLPIEETQSRRPVTVVRQDDEFVGIWEDYSLGLPDLWMQNFSSAGIVDNPMHISPGGAVNEQVGTAALVGHPDESFTLYWERGDTSSTRIEQLSFDPENRPLGMARPMLPDVHVQRHPVFSVAGGGRYALGWRESGTQSYRVRASVFSAEGVALQEGLILDQSSQRFLDGLAVALGKDGLLRGAWERWAPLAAAPDLMFGRWDSLGNAVGQPLTVVSAAQGGGRFASVAVEPGGYQMLVWRQGAVQGVNASIRAKVLDPTGKPTATDIRVSAEAPEFLGSSGRPVVKASAVTGRFIVLWQEFFGDHQHLYYRLYSSRGDSLEFPGGQGFRGTFDSGDLGGAVVSQTSPAVTVDLLGNHLILWVEKQIGGTAQLLGRKIDSLGLSVGNTFRVPGVNMASLPTVSLLAPDRVALAWVDTIGDRTRLLVQSLQVNLTNLSGQLAFDASTLSAAPVWVHIEGNVIDSARTDAAGNFTFRTLTDGYYRLRATSGGQELSLSRNAFSLGGGKDVSLGRIEVLGLGGAPGLPGATHPILYQNTPNPFNPSTTISFELPQSMGALPVSLRIYDIRGGLVRVLLERELSGGKRQVEWDGRDSQGRPAPSGVYFYRLAAGGQSAVRKMILLK